MRSIARSEPAAAGGGWRDLHLFGIEIGLTIAGDMFGEAVEGEATGGGVVENGGESPDGVLAELARV